jgi:RNA polymerase sigma-70 factor (ECF subfamily)
MDEFAFRALFDATYRALAQYASHRGLGRDDAEDLIASTYEVAWRRLDAVSEGDEALLWLYTVAHNQFRNLWRRRQRDSALVARLPRPIHAEPAGDPGDPPMQEIVRALDGLGDDDRS